MVLLNKIRSSHAFLAASCFSRHSSHDATTQDKAMLLSVLMTCANVLVRTFLSGVELKVES